MGGWLGLGEGVGVGEREGEKEVKGEVGVYRVRSLGYDR